MGAVPRTVEAATRLLEQFAELEGDLAEIEANRAACIADVNARCDTAANALIERREGLRSVLEPWWAKNAAALTEGKRKSIELGGCMIGTRAGRPCLGLVGKEDAAVERLKKLDWGQLLLRVKHTLDRAAVLKELAGEHGRTLKRIGFGIVPAAETFFVERVEQEGTRS